MKATPRIADRKNPCRFIAIAAFAAVMLAALITAGCAKPGADTPASPKGSSAGQGGQGGPGKGKSSVIPVQAVTAQAGMLSVDRTTAGVVTATVQSQVAAQVAGVVLKVHHTAGDWVKSGDTVVQLDDAQLSLSLATAEAALENAKINLTIGQDNSSQANPKLALQVQSAQSAYDSAQKNYEAQKALYDLEGISASQLDTASSQLSAAQANLEGAKSSLSQNNSAGDQSLAQLKLAVKQAQNQLDQARLNLRNTTIRAPFAGQIAAVNMQPGMYAGLNTPVFTLVSAERRIAFNISPGDTGFLKAGTGIQFVYGGKTWPVRVSQAPSSPVSGVVPMVASGSGIDFPYGSVGNIVYRVSLAQGVIVPIASLATLANQNYVFAVKDGLAVARNVTIIAEAGTSAAVDGIADGDVVIVSPPPGLIQGSPVRPTIIKDAIAPAGTP